MSLPETPQSYALRVLQQIDDNRLTKDDIVLLRERLKKSRFSDPEHRRLSARLARYQRLMLRDPLAALETVAPYLAPTNTPTGSVTSKALPVLLSSLNTWRINDETAECAIEAAYAFADAKQPAVGLTASAFVNDHQNIAAQIYAAECGGDMVLAAHDLVKAEELFRYGIRLIEYIQKTETEGISAEQQYIRQRIEKKRAEVARQLEAERYGAGFIAYREAERLRRQDKRLLAAMLAYEDIRKTFDKTVYGEASGAYRINCLLLLSEPGLRESTLSEIQTATRQLDEARKSVFFVEHELEPSAAKVLAPEYRALVQERETYRNRLLAVPTGNSALIAADRESAAFLKENRYGLYRGEVLVTMAEHAFHRMFEPKSAFEKYTEAWDWLEQVGKLEVELTNYDVPGKTKVVSAPPAEEKNMTLLGKVRKNEPRIGAIINRRTCGWYLDDLRERCALALGFLHFVKGEQDKAKSWYAKLPVLDKITGRLQSEGEWNNYTRLTWGADHGYLYAYPEELQGFDARRKFIVLLADHHYCSEQYSEGLALTRRFLAGEFGVLTPSQKTYMHVLAGSILYRTEGRKPAFQEFARACEIKTNSFSRDRALLMAAAVSARERDIRVHVQGHEYLKELAHSNRQNKFVYDAMIEYGLRMFYVGKVEEGRKMLKSLPEYSKGYRELALFYLKEQEERLTQKGVPSKGAGG